MISVAAELAGMHPQTLRIYESRGLIKPKRSPKKTRLYSQRDVERLRRIQELTTEVGTEPRRRRARARARGGDGRDAGPARRRCERRPSELEREMLARIEQVHRSYKRELVRWEPPGAILRDPATPSAFTFGFRELHRETKQPMQADKFTIKSQEAIQAAQRLAHERGNPEITPEHLLAVLIEQEGGIVPPLLGKLGARAERSAPS